VDDASPAWRLERFSENFESWIERESPSTDLRILVGTWIWTRTETPYQGVHRAGGFENLWFGAVPNTDDGLGHVVACSYWIEESRHAVRCDNFATLDLPL
jgi:hypothetical protein